MAGDGAETGHVPVLLEETMDGLCIRQGGVYLDGTLGAGGHAAAILARHSATRVVGIDRDPQALRAAASALAPFGDRVRLVQADFRDLGRVLDAAGITHVDGVILDLGVSSLQLDAPERGFSFLRDGPLDMRMDRTAGTPAWQIVNRWSKADLARLLRRLGEEKRARDIAGVIVREREGSPIMRTSHLAAIVASVRGMGRTRSIHPATRTFQALRIEVNDELSALRAVVPEAVERLREGGRMAVISFHSLEDRIVKRIFRELEDPCVCPREFHECRCGRASSGRVVTKRPILPSTKEIEANPRSRSAKLRIFEKRGDRAETE